MNAVRKFIHALGNRPQSNRFERYYGGILRTGTGYPTADEARKDLRNYDASFVPYNWPR